MHVKLKKKVDTVFECVHLSFKVYNGVVEGERGRQRLQSDI